MDYQFDLQALRHDGGACNIRAGYIARSTKCIIEEMGVPAKGNYPKNNEFF